jgi:hypothetical protein
VGEFTERAAVKLDWEGLKLPAVLIGPSGEAEDSEWKSGAVEDSLVVRIVGEGRTSRVPRLGWFAERGGALRSTLITLVYAWLA